jgi:hypothetical protein
VFDAEIFPQIPYLEKSGPNFSGSSADAGLFGAFIQTEKHRFKMDAGRKEPDQKTFKALVRLCSGYSHFYPPRRFPVAPFPGRNPRSPEEPSNFFCLRIPSFPDFCGLIPVLGFFDSLAILIKMAILWKIS